MKNKTKEKNTLKSSTTDKTTLTIKSSVYMSRNEWLDTVIIKSIPFVGFFALLRWVKDENTKPCKKSWAKAVLIKKLINLGILLLAIGLITAALFIWGDYFIEKIQPLLDLIQLQKNITGTDFMINENSIQAIQKVLDTYVIK